MKKFKFFLFAAAAAIISVSLSACSDDDDDESYPKNLIGRWQSESRISRTSWDSGETSESESAYYETEVEFFDDGTYYVYKGGAPFWQSSEYPDGKWSYKNGYITTKWGSDYDEIDRSHVLNLTPTTLELEITEYDDHKGYTDYNCVSFIKVE